jgi:glutamyl-tRNA synthetase
MSKVITRFAPSPTGYLHIGGARTALYNWLYSRHVGGTFHLRIEDTDRARSTQDAVDAIFEGLKWLGLDWDGEPIMQFARMNRHAEIAHELVKKGKAYYCYATPEELEQMRQKMGQYVSINHLLRSMTMSSSCV